MANLLEGKKVAEPLYSKILLDVSLLPSIPKVVFVLVGEDPASKTYVGAKGKKCADLGLQSVTVQLPDSIRQDEILRKISELNRDKSVHGILVQLPLPNGIEKNRVLEAIDPMKDVDGLHPENAGRLMQGEPRFVACTPAGIIEMLKFYSIPMEGKRAVVIGRSEIVGKPMAQLLLMNNATVTIAHSKTKDLKQICREADILVVAMGKPRFVTKDYVKPGAVVVDVGIHRTATGLVGDVDFESVSSVASAVSPVPGGVGPLTICMLMKNLLLAATLQQKK